MKRFVFTLISIAFYINLLSAQFDNPVSWRYKVSEPVNDEQEIIFTAVISEPWHVYAIKLEKEGPIPTTFTFEENPNLKLSGELTELTKPIMKFDEGFKFNVGMYSKKAQFSQKVKNLTTEPATLKVSIEYQCCNDETCLPPVTQEMDITLAAGKVAAAAVTEVPKEIKPAVARQDNTNVVSTDTFVKSVVPAEPAAEIISSTPPEQPEQKESMLVFLLIAFLAGLAAILTPCVFPMIPMTVSFFLRGSENRGNAILKGLVFGLSMILVYTGIGVLVSLLGVNADIGNVLSTHWIPNTIFFLLFMVFAASFLGMFELVLPSGLVNKADQNADKGGIAGSFFMGVTTVLVSFSCTGPIVGSLLISATGGAVLKPILGMFFFSLAFALPFTLLAIFPSMMKNLPKSGGWLNSVKVVLGFIVLAFGMKFLSSMDQSYHLGIFSREIYLAIWLVISVLLGLYLLGRIKFAHDSELQSVSVPRLLMAMASFVFAIYLFTGIFGADLKLISSLIPPKSTSAFHFSSNNNVSQTSSSETFCGPGKYEDLFELPLDLKGYFNYADGINCARTRNKPVFLEFTGHFCSNCKQMENQVWPDASVINQLRDEYVIISLYTDDKTRLPENEWITTKDGKVLKTLGDINKEFEIANYNTIATPWYVLIDADGKLLADPRGKDLDINSFSAYLKSGITAYQSK